LRQVGDISVTDSEYYFGLVSPEFNATKAYRAVQKVATTEDQIATPGDWGPLSSAVQAPPDWQIKLDSAVPGGMYVSPSAVGNTLDVTFLGNQASVMLVPLAAGNTEQVVSARYYVTIDGSSSKVAPDLHRDTNGQAYIDVPTGGNPRQVTVAMGLNSEMPTGQHTLEINVAANPPGGQAQPGLHTFSPLAQQPDLPGIGIITVQAHRSYIVFALFTLLLLLAITYALLAIRRNGPPAETRNEK
jgi:hypothetical protein